MLYTISRLMIDGGWWAGSQMYYIGRYVLYGHEQTMEEKLIEMQEKELERIALLEKQISELKKIITQ